MEYFPSNITVRAKGMNIVELDSFERFEMKSATLHEELIRKKGTAGSKLSPLLFRGHAKASWRLKTTLERYTCRSYSMEDYYRVMEAVRPAVQSFTERRWDLPHEYSFDGPFPQSPQSYEFMVYLRHHGFPSPLLDWTRSPYVAAFFAFNSARDDDCVAIYTYVEYPDLGKAGNLEEATIVGCGPYITTHPRHFQQQSEYTYCKKRVKDKYVYCSHEEAFGRNDENQDVLNKFILPASERKAVMERLHLMNISAYSMFGSEESLLSTMAYHEIENRKL